MIAISTVLGTLIKEGFRHIKVRVMGPRDIQTPVEASPFGLDSNPVNAIAAIYAKSTVSGETIILGYPQEQNRLAEPGEVRFYSTDAEEVQKNYFWLKNNGTIEVGGNADNLVRYSELETAYNQLKSDHDGVVDDNNNLKTALAALVSALTSAGGTPLTGISLGTIVSTALAAYYGAPLLPSTGDITPAKIDEIKTS